jgi:hypothetical protein
LSELYIPSGHGIVSWIFALSGSSHQFGFTHGVDVENAFIADPQNVADDAADAFLSGYTAAAMYNAWTFVSTHVLLRQGSSFYSADSVHNTPGTGGSGATNTANLAMIVQKKTIFAGRRFRGRMYFPAFSLVDADVDNTGHIDPAVVTTLQGQVDDFRSAWEGKDSVEHLNLLHTSSLADPTPDGTTVTDWTVEALCGTQRRRMR